MDESKPTQVEDDDRYWKHGVYNNSNDPRILVTKRNGIGYSYNIGSPNGKRVFYGILIVVAVILLAVIFMFLLPLFNPFKLSIGTDTVTIHAPVYATSFPLSGIREVQMIDTLPGGTRTNGTSTGQYDLGNFTLDGYGKSKMYVYKDHSPFLVIRLDNLAVFYNSKDAAETQLIYTELLRDIK
jgi:hypothetical protein